MYITIETQKEVSIDSITQEMLGNRYFVERCRTFYAKEKKASSSWFVSEYPNFDKWITSYISHYAKQYFELYQAVLVGKEKRCNSVFATLESMPAGGNLDKGKHYYNVYYVVNGGASRFNVAPLMDRTRSGNLCFGSGAIGMSRLVDATDIVFCYLRDLTGVYVQLDTVL
jgi:hypothetical protein